MTRLLKNIFMQRKLKELSFVVVREFKIDGKFSVIESEAETLYSGVAG